VKEVIRLLRKWASWIESVWVEEPLYGLRGSLNGTLGTHLRLFKRRTFSSVTIAFLTFYRFQKGFLDDSLVNPVCPTNSCLSNEIMRFHWKNSARVKIGSVKAVFAKCFFAQKADQGVKRLFSAQIFWKIKKNASSPLFLIENRKVYSLEKRQMGQR
jgi:hypothetical protein